MYDFPIYHHKRNNELRDYLRNNYISHRRLAEVITNKQTEICKWKNKISRFCSITHPQQILDEDWNKIQNAIKNLIC